MLYVLLQVRGFLSPSHTQFQDRRVILIIWIASAVSALPWAVFAKVNYIKYKGQDLVESAWCSMPFHEKDFDTTPLYFTIASTFLYFVVPFSIVFVLYLR